MTVHAFLFTCINIGHSISKPAGRAPSNLRPVRKQNRDRPLNYIADWSANVRDSIDCLGSGPALASVQYAVAKLEAAGIYASPQDAEDLTPGRCASGDGPYFGGPQPHPARSFCLPLNGNQRGSRGLHMCVYMSHNSYTRTTCPSPNSIRMEAVGRAGRN